MLNESGTMTITRCTISNNSAQYDTGSSGDQCNWLWRRDIELLGRLTDYY